MSLEAQKVTVLEEIGHFCVQLLTVHLVNMHQQCVVVVGIFCALLIFEPIGAQMFCEKVEFNQSMYSKFRSCTNKLLPIMVVKDYASHREIPAYRPTSRFFLSTYTEGDSCVELTTRFSLNSNSRIESAIYLKSMLRSFVEITVYDMDKYGQPVYSWRNETANRWIIVQGEIRLSIPNAQVSTLKNFSCEKKISVLLNICRLRYARMWLHKALKVPRVCLPSTIFIYWIWR